MANHVYIKRMYNEMQFFISRIKKVSPHAPWQAHGRVIFRSVDAAA